MNDVDAFDFREALVETYDSIASHVLALAPQLAVALLLLLFGWIIAHVVRIATKRLVGGFDSILNRAVRVDGTEQARIRRSYALVSSKVMFWAVMIFFVAATANIFGWQLFSDWMNSVVAYLPSLIAGLLLVLAGLIIGSGAKAVITKAAVSAGLEQGDILGRVAQIVVVVTMTVIGVEQAGINVHFLTTALVVISGVFFAGGALAFGLGAKSLVANIIGAQYARKHCRIGERLRIGDVEGVVTEIAQTSILLETSDGRSVVPAGLFHEAVTNLASESTTTLEAENTVNRPKSDER